MFSVGDRVWIYRSATVAWLDALHMRELAANYANNVDWTPDAYSIYWERKVTAVDGYRIRLDNPVVMCIGGEAACGTGSLCKGEWPRISECGIEEMVLDTRFNASVRNGDDFTDEDHAWSGVTVRNTEHSWVRNILPVHPEPLGDRTELVHRQHRGKAHGNPDLFRQSGRPSRRNLDLPGGPCHSGIPV